jgi:hypothetical protein
MFGNDGLGRYEYGRLFDESKLVHITSIDFLCKLSTSRNPHLYFISVPIRTSVETNL